MLASSQLFTLLRFAAPLMLIVWSIGYLLNVTSAYTAVLRQFKDEKDLFVSDFLEHEIDGQFDGSSIADLCKRKQWTRDLFLSCESPAGGVGNVKNAYLNCIRLAIEMGAELILPGIIPRNDKKIAEITPDAKAPIRGNEMDYMFDIDHLNASLTNYCPQLRLHRSLNDLWEIPSLLTSHPIAVGDLGIPLVNTSIISDTSKVAAALKTYIDTKSPPDERRHPVRFHLRVTNWVWPTAADGPPLARHFGRILRIRSDARRVAAAALFTLHKRFDLRLDSRRGLRNDSFVGVHLRTEPDTAGKAFPSYEEQAAYYLDYAVRSGSAVVFLATGATEANVTAFAERARDFNITTVLKKDIVTDPEDRAVLNRFSYDQRALVDYEIMLRAGQMTGTGESPFAWNLAMRRRNAYGAPREGEGEGEIGGSVLFKDRFSTIFGKGTEALRMRDTIWP